LKLFRRIPMSAFTAAASSITYHPASIELTVTRREGKDGGSDQQPGSVR
jgi:hypothetical protein